MSGSSTTCNMGQGVRLLSPGNLGVTPHGVSDLRIRTGSLFFYDSIKVNVQVRGKLRSTTLFLSCRVIFPLQCHLTQLAKKRSPSRMRTTVKSFTFVVWKFLLLSDYCFSILSMDRASWCIFFCPLFSRYLVFFRSTSLRSCETL